MKVKIVTLGCKVNQYESEAMLEALLEGGFQEAGPGEEADLVVVNSCTVTATGDQKARQTLRREKRNNPGAVTVLTGCFPQAFPQEAEKLLEADVVLGNAQRSILLPRVLQYMSSKQRIVDIAPHKAGEAFERMKVSSFHGRTRAFVKIEDGCDRFCSYCIIPYARGRVRSKPIPELREELRALGEKGYREIVLTGINLPAYGKDTGDSLCDAVEAACAVPEIQRVRLGSLEPEQLTEEVVARLRLEEKLCPQFHLSLQSGSRDTLSRMNRHYTPEEYREIVERLRRAFPNCAMTTDVMVGFPGETEEEFWESLAFVADIGFAKVHTFPYSRRPGTKAFSAPNQVPEKEKESRARKMAEAAAQSRRAFLQEQLGRTEEVLFEREREKNVYEGYTRNYTPVRLVSTRPLQGLLLPVVLQDMVGDGCGGTLLDRPKMG